MASPSSVTAGENDAAGGETLSGWLQKRERGFSGTERWRRCWFVLSNLGGGDDEWTLSHYEHGTNMREFVGAERLAQGERKVSAVANIQKILFVGSKGNKFDVVFRDGTPKMSLRAANEDVCKRWVYAILRLKRDLEKPQEVDTPRGTAGGAPGAKASGAVSSYSLKPDGFDRRRERESVKMTATFLKDSEVFMAKAALFGQRAMQQQTLGRRGRAAGGTRRRGFGDTLKSQPGSSRADSEHQEEDDDAEDDADRADPPPPPPSAARASFDDAPGRSASSGAEPKSAQSSSHGRDDDEGDFEQEGFSDAARKQREVGGGGSWLCARRAKPKRTAKLEDIPIPSAPGARGQKSLVAAKSERTSSSVGSADVNEPPPSSDKARATLEQQQKKKKAAQSTRGGGGSIRFLKPGPSSAGRKANTVVGDETLRRRELREGTGGPSMPVKARTGANVPKKPEEPGPRMAVRPMARMNQPLPEGRVQVKSVATAALIRETIEDSYSLSGMLFDDLDQHSMQDLVDSMYRVDVKAEDEVVSQGEVGDTFFVIEKGKYRVYLRRNDPNALPELVAEKGPRTFFGELALLYEQPAPVTVRAVTDGVLWAINRSSFFDIRKAQARKRQARKLRCLYGIDVLAENLPDSDLVALAEAMDERVYRKGDVLLEAGARVTQVIIVGSGRVDMLAGDTVRAQLTRGDSFGESALLERGVKAELRLVASEDRTTLLTLDVDEFEALLGTMRDVIMKNWLGQTPAPPAAASGARGGSAKMRAAGGSSKMRAAGGSSKMRAAPSLPAMAAKPGSGKGSGAAARRKSKADVDSYLRSTLLLLKEKDLDRQQSFKESGKSDGQAKKSTRRGKGSRAAKALMEEQAVPGRDEDEEEDPDKEDGDLEAFAEGPGTARLPSAASASTVDSYSDEEDSSAAAAEEAKGDVERDWERAPLACEGVSLNDLEPLERLGKGSFGRVHLVREVGDIKFTHPSTGAELPVPRYMALKVLSRDYIASNGWQEMVENERHAMAELVLHCADCPFIVRLFAAFFDKKNIYFLMELCSGGDMYGVLRKLKGEPRLTEKEARFYVLSTCLGMEAIHSRGIVYRDLKPENVFLSADGYVRIADFGLAKKTTRTFTVCGTPEYMAPEIILGRGHDSAVDWWAVGVFCFELISGVSPFPGRSPMDIYESVLAHSEDGKLKFPDHATFSKDCKAFVGTLLNPNKSKRLAPVRRGIASHAFFNKFQTDKLIAGKVKPPLKLKQKDFRRYEAPGFKNNYHPKFSDTPVDRSGWEPAI